MITNVFFLVVLIASVACSFDFAAADNVQKSTRSNLHGATATRYLEENKKDLLPNEDEERAAPLNALTRFKGLFCSQPNKTMEAKNFNKQDAIGALTS
ncbi:hypothetical protein V7S43_008504 [Phytophthora oleae]|uniref:RxLR effector protein n=1 Tax=Phytophthora oleae TaxID=2107226 RepID=A0ABD3FHK3_9STRA